VGYLAGVAVIMMVSQLEKVTGVPVEGDSFVSGIVSFFGQLGRVHPPTVMLAAGVLIFLLVAGKLFPRLPIPLLGVLLAAGVTAVFSLEDSGIKVVGEVPTGLPAPGMPAVSVSDLTTLLLPAVGVAIVGYTDNMLTGRAFATRNGYR